MVAKPIADGTQYHGNIRNPATAGGDGHIPARNNEIERVELSMHRGADVDERV
jgi:hypothetical protein